MTLVRSEECDYITCCNATFQTWVLGFLQWERFDVDKKEGLYKTKICKYNSIWTDKKIYNVVIFNNTGFLNKSKSLKMLLFY